MPFVALAFDEIWCLAYFAFHIDLRAWTQITEFEMCSKIYSWTWSRVDRRKL